MTDPGPAPLLFGFRGIRFLQGVAAVAAVSLGIAGVLSLMSYGESRDWPLLLLAAMFAVLFIWLFGLALRLPTSFVAISPDRMRIRFAGFVDTILDTQDVEGAELINWSWWRGLGVRTALAGDVALVAAWGTAAQVTLKRPIRVWLIPRLWRVSATRVVLSVRNPHKMVERFGPVPVKPAASKKKRR